MNHDLVANVATLCRKEFDKPKKNQHPEVLARVVVDMIWKHIESNLHANLSTLMSQTVTDILNDMPWENKDD